MKRFFIIVLPTVPINFSNSVFLYDYLLVSLMHNQYSRFPLFHLVGTLLRLFEKVGFEPIVY